MSLGARRAVSRPCSVSCRLLHPIRLCFMPLSVAITCWPAPKQWSMASAGEARSAKHRNWPDLRVDTSSGKKGDPHLPDEEKYMVAWCHGAPGIGLARLGSLKVLDDDAIRAEIDAALATTLAMGFGMNHSLCHGDMGNLDTLLLAAQVLDKPEDRKRIDNIAAMLLDTIDRQGWVTGVPLGVETPGLMVGLAGTGYALLRLGEPEKVPSVLLGEPPRKPE